MPDAIFYFKDSTIPNEIAGIPSGIFLPVRDGLKNEMLVEIEYENAVNHQKRKILPEVLFRSSEDWYVAAYCLARDEPRTFRLDRIISASLTDIRETTYGVAQDIRENGIPWNRVPKTPAADRTDEERPHGLWLKVEITPGENGPEIQVSGSESGKPHPKTIRDFSFDLVYDAEHGDLERIKEDLAAGADINFIAGDGNTPFSAAVSFGDLNIMKYLLEHGADPYAKMLDGGTALIRAAWQGKMNVARYLVETLHFDVNAADGQGRTPLYCAVLDSHLELVAYLLEHGADIQCTARGGITLLMGAMNAPSNSEDQILMLAERLIFHGVDIHAQDRKGRTALYYALEKDRLNCVQYLMAAGISAVHFDKKGVSPLLFAFQHFDEMTWRIQEPYRHKPERYQMMEMTVRCLVENGADINAADRQGIAPVMLAHGANLKYLLELGACAKVFDRNGKTAAMYHAMQFDELALLKEYGADLQTRDFEGNDILMSVPAEYGTIRELVTRFGLPVNGRNNRGETILHRAVRKPDGALVKFLIRHGADPYAENEDGDTPADHISLTYIYRRRRKLFLRAKKNLTGFMDDLAGDGNLTP